MCCKHFVTVGCPSFAVDRKRLCEQLITDTKSRIQMRTSSFASQSPQLASLSLLCTAPQPESEGISAGIHDTSLAKKQTKKTGEEQLSSLWLLLG